MILCEGISQFTNSIDKGFLSWEMPSWQLFVSIIALLIFAKNASLLRFADAIAREVSQARNKRAYMRKKEEA
jgi:hypothetical protein